MRSSALYFSAMLEMFILKLYNGSIKPNRRNYYGIQKIRCSISQYRTGVFIYYLSGGDKFFDIKWY